MLDPDRPARVLHPARAARRATQPAPLAVVAAGFLLAAGPLSTLTGSDAHASVQAPIKATLVVGDLDWPVGFDVAPDGRIFYGARFTGQIRIFDPDSGTDVLFFTVSDLVIEGERGLIGLALHPDYPTRPFVYVFVSRDLGAGPRSHILRIRDAGGTGGAVTMIFDEASAELKNAGRIVFGPDRHLYVGIGDGEDAAAAQDLASVKGKVLRMTPTGGIPPDNPINGSLVFAYGLRNPFGMAFDPLSGKLWATDNGPECNDELDGIRPAGNYGWGPSNTCDSPPPPPINTNQDGTNPILPKSFYNPPFAPTGIAFCAGCRLGQASEGRIFFGTFVTRQIHRVTLDAARRDVVSQKVVLDHPGPILGMEAGPDGTIYFSTRTGILKLEHDP